MRSWPEKFSSPLLLVDFDSGAVFTADGPEQAHLLYDTVWEKSGMGLAYSPALDQWTVWVQETLRSHLRLAMQQLRFLVASGRVSSHSKLELCFVPKDRLAATKFFNFPSVQFILSDGFSISFSQLMMQDDSMAEVGSALVALGTKAGLVRSLTAEAHGITKDAYVVCSQAYKKATVLFVLSDRAFIFEHSPCGFSQVAFSSSPDVAKLHEELEDSYTRSAPWAEDPLSDGADHLVRSLLPFSI